MKLHNYIDEFDELIDLTSKKINIPSTAVSKDYFITMLLGNLEVSEFAKSVVFKGGTSLSKCYPGTIERFSEDIDLTFVPANNMTDKQISRLLKKIESSIIMDFHYEIIPDERNNRNKSSYVWFSEEKREEEKVKLEIGSCVRPHPHSKKTLKSYIHEYLEAEGFVKEVEEYELRQVEIETLDITRTFIDKIMAVKRHAICGSLAMKSRHIYDVVRLVDYTEIIDFMKNSTQLRELIKLTKITDSIYLEKRNIPKEYNPSGSFGFEKWKHKFDNSVRSVYEDLHKTILYTETKQEFERAIAVFETINTRMKELDE